MTTAPHKVLAGIFLWLGTTSVVFSIVHDLPGEALGDVLLFVLSEVCRDWRER